MITSPISSSTGTITETTTAAKGTTQSQSSKNQPKGK